ncbi:class F sortase [Actinoplanes sp. TFC3]|uniref:class F sortase n=1 Tax=Actinoplanes sp. TFC3 TaxID=1710355 RepID=UPI000B1A73FC|nr:class F sortase [Actinoplanes sp. TFC3]
MTVRTTARRAILPVSVALLTAFVVGTGYLMLRDPQDTGDRGRWAAPVASPAEVPERAVAVPSDWPDPEGVSDPFGQAANALSGPPTHLRVEAIGVDADLEDLHKGADGELVAPKGNEKAGWYAEGTAPGDLGPAVLAGHVDSKSGPAVFYRLREMTAGDRIEVTRGGKTLTFTVTSTAWYPKVAFPSERVYGPTPDRELRLITCGGVFDRKLRSYRDNLVVYAVAG